MQSSSRTKTHCMRVSDAVHGVRQEHGGTHTGAALCPPLSAPARTLDTGSCSSIVTRWGDSGRGCSGCCTGSKVVQWACRARGSTLAMACRQLRTARRTREDRNLQRAQRRGDLHHRDLGNRDTRKEGGGTWTEAVGGLQTGACNETWTSACKAGGLGAGARGRTWTCNTRKVARALSSRRVCALPFWLPSVVRHGGKRAAWQWEQWRGARWVLSCLSGAARLRVAKLREANTLCKCLLKCKPALT